MQFQVPQFIETEDKIVGPFTLRQFAFVGIAGALSALLYFSVQTWLWAIGSIIIFGAAGAFAFVKVEGRPLFKVVTAAFGFYWKPQTYIWKSEQATAAAHTQSEGGISLENVLANAALHKQWEHLQTGEKAEPAKTVEHKMTGRYQILEKITGDRKAAKRVDYR